MKFWLCHESFLKTINTRVRLAFFNKWANLALREVKECASTPQVSTTDQGFHPTNI